MTDTSPTPTPPPPNSVTVHKHITLVQIVSMILCFAAALLTFLQALPPSISWVAPATMFTSAAVAALGMLAKTWNSSQLPALLVMGILLIGAEGCSNLTPNQTYKIDYALYIGADVGLSAAIKTGKVPSTEVSAIQSALQAAAQKLADGRAWIVANPNLANTVGVYPAEFTAVAAVIEILQQQLAKYTLLSPLPAPLPPQPPATTVPADLIPTP